MKSQITLSRILVFFASVIFIWVFFLSVWYSTNIQNSQNFVAKTTNVLESEEVRNAISAEVLDRVVERRPILGRITQPILTNVIAGVLASDLFSNVYEKAAKELHLQLTSKDPRELAVNIAPAKNFILLLKQDEDPQIIANVPDEIVIVRKNQIPSLYKFGTTLTLVGPILLIIGLIFLVDLWRKFDNKRTYLAILGLVFSGSAFIIYGLVPALGNYITAHADSANVATKINQIYVEFTNPISVWARYVFFLGLIVAFLARFFRTELFRISRKKK